MATQPVGTAIGAEAALLLFTTKLGAHVHGIKAGVPTLVAEWFSFFLHLAHKFAGNSSWQGKKHGLM